ncbi:TPA: DUF1738 domain-containing protein [Stenotrophomonas maltophilia]|nr:DUF1738 domain-containing protein [Stenotrophomonas maltophilia]
MSAASELKQDIAEKFYDQLAERRSVLDHGFRETETPLSMIGGWPIGPSGYPFKDFNALQLMTVSLDRGFTSPIYMKSEQIKKNGYYIAKGESKATKIESTYKQEDGDFKSVMAVCFNGDQIKNLPQNKHTYAWQGLADNRDAFLDDMIAKTGAKFSFDPMNAPYYERSTDTLYMRPQTEYATKHADGKSAYYNDVMFLLADWATHPSRYHGVQPGEQGSEQDSQYRLGRQLALLQIASRLGMTYEPDDSGWANNYINSRPNWQELERAAKAADTILKTIGVPEVQQEPVRSKVWKQEASQAFRPTVQPADHQQAQQQVDPVQAFVEDKIQVVHVADKPSKQVGKAVKKAAAQKLNGAKQTLTL